MNNLYCFKKRKKESLFPRVKKGKNSFVKSLKGTNVVVVVVTAKLTRKKIIIDRRN